MSQDKDEVHYFIMSNLGQNNVLDHHNRIEEVCSKFKKIFIFTFDLSRHTPDSRVLIKHMKLEHALHLSQTFIRVHVMFYESQCYY